jgi:signal peptidase I
VYNANIKVMNMNTQETQNDTNRWKSELWDFIKTLIIFGIVYFVVRTYIAQPFLVRGRSMEETFSDGDYLIVDELSYKIRTPKRYEVIVFETGFLPSGADQSYYIKRVIGLPGDRVVIQDGKVTVYEGNSENGTQLEEKYLTKGIITQSPEPVDVVLSENKYFVLGDNRGNSADSRYWGELDISYIVGKPLLRLYPFNTLTVFTQETFIGDNQ